MKKKVIQIIKIGNLEVYGIIYKIENIVNNKVYIGQTTRKDGFKGRYIGNNNTSPIEWVYNYHNTANDKGIYCNKYLLNSIEKYGFNNFKIIQIFDVAFSEKELNIKEKCWIKYYKSNIRKYGFNFTDGGDTFKPSKDSAIYDGNKIYCINNGIIFKSYNDAIRYFKNENNSITAKWIIKSFNIKSIYIKKYKKPLFVKYNEEEFKNYKYCQKCGKKYKLNKRSYGTKRKYCYKCSSLLNNHNKYSNKIESIHIEYIIKLYKENNNIDLIIKNLKNNFDIKITRKKIKSILTGLYIKNKI